MSVLIVLLLWHAWSYPNTNCHTGKMPYLVGMPISVIAYLLGKVTPKPLPSFDVTDHSRHLFLKISSVSNNEQTLQKVLKFYPGFRNLIMTLICRFICVFVSLFVCISDLFSSRIFWKYVACVFFSSRIEIHCFIKGKLPEKSRCKILSARFPKTLFSWYF